MIDLHCHILPGLDDGAQTLDESLDMARIASKDGITKIVATPHMFRDAHMTKDFSIIRQKVLDLNSALNEAQIPVEVFTGAELFLSPNLLEEIDKNPSYLTLNESAYVIIELPPGQVFLGVQSLFFDLMSRGIVPILAHPERNDFFVQNPSWLYKLIIHGCFIQANAGSFLGIYGRKVREAVFYFLKMNFIHFIASDGHNTRNIAPRLTQAVNAVAKVIGEEKSHFLVEENPQSVLQNRELPDLWQPINPHDKKKTLKIQIPKFFKKGQI